MCQTVSAASAPSLEVPSVHDFSKNENLMDIVESDKAERPIVVQLARVALVAVMVTIAVWVVTNYALDSLGVSFFK